MEPWRAPVVGEKRCDTALDIITSMSPSLNRFLSIDSKGREILLSLSRFQMTSRSTVSYADLISKNDNVGIEPWDTLWKRQSSCRQNAWPKRNLCTGFFQIICASDFALPALRY